MPTATIPKNTGLKENQTIKIESINALLSRIDTYQDYITMAQSTMSKEMLDATARDYKSSVLKVLNGLIKLINKQKKISHDKKIIEVLASELEEITEVVEKLGQSATEGSITDVLDDIREVLEKIKANEGIISK